MRAIQRTSDELKSKFDPLVLTIQHFILPPDFSAPFVASPQNTKTALNIHMITHVTAQI